MSKLSAIITGIVLIIVVGAVFATPENYPPCPTEDSTWCVWSGGQNQQGSTVINLWGDIYFTL